MKPFHLLAALALASALLSCGKAASDPKPEPPTPTPPSEKIPIRISTDVSTKATETGFENSDAVGIYVVNVPGSLAASGNHVTNKKFVFNGTDWTSDTQSYWEDQTTHADFYAYYPYSASVSDIASYAFSVQADQATESKYKSSIFLWGKSADLTPTPDPIHITTNHRMSKLLITLQAGTGWTDADIDAAELTVCGLKTEARINLANGNVTASGTAADLKPLKLSSGQYKLLVVPQNVQSQDLVKIKIGSNDYVLNTSINLQPNHQHKCPIIVNRTGEGVNVGIGAWETDEIDYGGTVE